MKKLFCLCACALLVGACSKKNDPVANAQQAAADKDLQHTFASDCVPTPGAMVITGLATGFQGKDAGSKVTYNFTGARISRKTEVYATAGCTGDPNYSYTESGTFTVHKDPNKKTNEGGYPIDIKYDKLMVNIVSQEGVTVANAGPNGLCGAKDWSQGKEKDVTAQSKDPSCYSAPLPRTVANLYKVDNKVLQLGTDAKKDVPDAKRPATLESTKYQQK